MCLYYNIHPDNDGKYFQRTLVPTSAHIQAWKQSKFLGAFETCLATKEKQSNQSITHMGN